MAPEARFSSDNFVRNVNEFYQSPQGLPSSFKFMALNSNYDTIKETDSTKLTLDTLALGHKYLVERGNHIVRDLLTNFTDCFHEKDIDIHVEKYHLTKSRKRFYWYSELDSNYFDSSYCALTTAMKTALNDAFYALHSFVHLDFEGSTKFSHRNEEETVVLLKFYMAQERANALFDAVCSTLSICSQKNREASPVLGRIGLILDSLKKYDCIKLDVRDRVEISSLTLPQLSFNVLLGIATFRNISSQTLSSNGVTKTSNLFQYGSRSDDEISPMMLKLRVITTVFLNDVWTKERRNYSTFSVELHECKNFGEPKRKEHSNFLNCLAKEDFSLVVSLRADEKLTQDESEKDQCMHVRHVRMVQTNTFPHKSYAPKEVYTSFTHGKKDLKLSIKFSYRCFTKCDPSDMLIEIVV